MRGALTVSVTSVEFIIIIDQNYAQLISVNEEFFKLDDLKNIFKIGKLKLIICEVVMKKIGLIDTTSSRINMGRFAEDTIAEFSKQNGWEVEIIRRTVPDFKDLAVSCRIALEDNECDICIAMGWIACKGVDAQCRHDLSLTLGLAQILSKKHILEVLVYEREAVNPQKLFEIAKNRTIDQSKNALLLLFAPERMMSNAGVGLRQGEIAAGSLMSSGITAMIRPRY